MKTLFAVIAVLVVFGGIMAWVVRGTLSGTQEKVGASRMRQLYGAWYLYSQDWNGNLAPDLYAVRTRLSSDDLLHPIEDPFQSEPGPYPADACLFREAHNTPLRVGYCYWGTGKASAEWQDVINDPKKILLTNPFSAKYELTGDRFGYTSEGSQMQITMLGAVTRSR